MLGLLTLAKEMDGKWKLLAMIYLGNNVFEGLGPKADCYTMAYTVFPGTVFTNNESFPRMWQSVSI